MKRTIYALSLTVLAVVAIALVFASTATAEIGWPTNEAGEPTDGGNWQGSGQMDIPPENIKADWYNTTDGDTDWIIESGDDITRSFSAFDFQYHLTIKSGGILRLDSVAFITNNSEENHMIIIEDGGQLIITNSSVSLFGVSLVSGSELYILPGNSSCSINIDSVDSAGFVVPDGATFEMRNTSLSGPCNLLTIEDENAIVQYCSFSSYADGTTLITLKASAAIGDNTFIEAAPTGSVAIFAEMGVTSEIFNNEFTGFKHGGPSTFGHAIVRHGPIEIYDNTFKRMVADNTGEPYVIYFLGSEPTEHDGKPVWETNRFIGKTNPANSERINMFMQAWNVDIFVLNEDSENPIEGAEVNVEDKDDFVVANGMTDATGVVTFEIAEYFVSAAEDGAEPSPPSTKNVQDNKPFDIDASKDGETAVLEDQTINMDKTFTLKLDLLEFDYGVSALDYPDLINAGDTITLDATVFNLGYDRATTVTVTFKLDDGSRTVSELGTVDVLVDKDSVHAYFDALIDLSLASTDVTFIAQTDFTGDKEIDNNVFTTPVAVHINEKPTVAISTPADGETFSGVITVTGTATDDVSVSSVQVNITGALDWTDANGTEDWMYEFDTTIIGLTNGDYTLNARSMDSDGAYSDVASLTFNVLNKPKVGITSPADGSLLLGNATTITMVGSAQKLDSDIKMITITIDGTTVINASKVSNDWSQWSFPLKTIAHDNINSLSDGEHTFTATVEDNAGLTNTYTVTYTIYSMGESSNPVVTITTDYFNLTSDKWIEGTATDDYKVTAVHFRVNDGDWSVATESLNLDSVSATWRVRLTPNNKDLVPGFTNLLYIRAFDDDGNTTATLQFNVLAEGLVDLKIDSAGIVLQNEAGATLKSADIKVDLLIKVFVPILVEGNAGNLEQVVVRLTVGGIVAGEYTKTNTSSTFTAEFSVLLKQTMLGKKDYSIRVDPPNQIEENNDDNTAEDNNEYVGELPGSVQEASGSSGGGSSGIPGFEAAFMVIALSIGGVMALFRKRD